MYTFVYQEINSSCILTSFPPFPLPVVTCSACSISTVSLAAVAPAPLSPALAVPARNVTSGRDAAFESCKSLSSAFRF